MTGKPNVTMRTVEAAATGYPDVLAVTTRPVPAPGADEVLIRVVAAGVNRADVLQRRGKYPPPPGAPTWPGLEVSGVIEALGPAVTAWKVGEEVCALLPGGGYADFVTVDSSLVLPAPAGVPLADAAALVESACTVWSNLATADAKPGERLLVHGGAGGIGSFALQYGVARGLTVFATAGSQERVELCRELGASEAWNYADQDWVREMRAAGGADIVLDVMGAAYLPRNVEALATGGRLVVIGLQGGTRGELDLGALLAKRARVIGTTLRSRPLAERAAIIAGVREDVWPLVPQLIKPVVAARFPLEAAADAHRLLEAGGVAGKILLEP